MILTRFVLLSTVLFAAPAWAQQQAEPQPAPVPAQPPATQPGAPPPTPPGQPTMVAPPAAQPPQMAPMGGKGVLRMHIVTTRQTYATMPYDVFSIATRQVVAQGQGVDEAMGVPAQTFELPPGLYKIVGRGEPFDIKSDYAMASVTAGQTLDYVVIVEPDTYQFRGSGPVTSEEQLPHQHKLLGFRINATVGGSFMMNEKENVVGNTSGFTTVTALFGNFGLVFDRGNHFLSIASDQTMGLTSTPTSSLVRNSDRWEGSALYAYNINNKYIGPYGRAGFKTQLFPGYVYLQSDSPTVQVDIYRKNQLTPDSRAFGTKANPDDLRVRVSDPFGPFVLQEELGANLKAVNLDLLLLKLSVATRVGFGFRQGFTNNLLVVEGSDKGNLVNLRETDDYSTLGPVIGATANVTFARWLFASSSFGMMFPVKDLDKERDFTITSGMLNSNELGYGSQLLIDFSGTAGLKLPILTDLLFASFDWTFRLERDAYITSATQFDQTLMARVNLSLF